MKKSLLLIAALFAFTFANAQGFRFGVKGGGNYSTLAGSDKEKVSVYIDNTAYDGKTDYKWGYHFGLTSLYQFDDFWGLKVDALYTTKGFQVNYSEPDLNSNNVGGTEKYEVKRSVNYISVPILLNINTGGLFFDLGPEVAYLTNSNSEIKTTVYKSNGDKLTDSNKSETKSSKKDLDSFDFGYVAGIGYMSHMGLGFDVRYNASFLKLYDNSTLNTRNSQFTASLFYMFGGNK